MTPIQSCLWKKTIVPFGDCLRITHKILRGLEIKLGHFQKLYQELTKYTRNCLFKNALFTRAVQYIVDIISYHLNNLNLASTVMDVE